MTWCAGANSKAAIIRQGLEEMRTFSKALYPTVRDDTFFHSCGVGDLVATCYGGRNRMVAEAWTKAHKEGKRTTFEQLETVSGDERAWAAGIALGRRPRVACATRPSLTLVALVLDPWSVAMQDLLKGQKLQGTLTSDEVQEIISSRGWEQRFPLFTTINRVINGHLTPEWVLRYDEGCKVDILALQSLVEKDELELPRRRRPNPKPVVVS